MEDIIYLVNGKIIYNFCKDCRCLVDLVQMNKGRLRCESPFCSYFLWSIDSDDLS